MCEGPPGWTALRRLQALGYALASFETHLPNALALPPYFALKAASPIVLRSVLQVFAALIVAACSAAVSACAAIETHLPKAFALLSFLPYLSLKACSPSVFRSSAHVFAAFCLFSALLAFCFETHLPIAFDLFAFVP